MESTQYYMTETLAVLISRFGAEWVLWLLLLLSVLSVAVMIERFLFFHRHRQDGSSLSFKLDQLLQNRDLDGARRLVDGHRTLESAVVREGLSGLEGGLQVAQEVMGVAVARERTRYERNLSILGTLANNAPFIGLFGTVLGVIKAFSDLSTNITGGASAVMAGISQALVTTAVGLLVALPAVVAYNYFKGRVKEVIRNAELVSRIISTYAHKNGNGHP